MRMAPPFPRQSPMPTLTIEKISRLKISRLNLDIAPLAFYFIHRAGPPLLLPILRSQTAQERTAMMRAGSRTLSCAEKRFVVLRLQPPTGDAPRGAQAYAQHQEARQVQCLRRSRTS